MALLGFLWLLIAEQYLEARSQTEFIYLTCVNCSVVVRIRAIGLHQTGNVSSKVGRECVNRGFIYLQFWYKISKIICCNIRILLVLSMTSHNLTTDNSLGIKITPNSGQDCLFVAFSQHIEIEATTTTTTDSSSTIRCGTTTVTFRSTLLQQTENTFSLPISKVFYKVL